MVALFPDKLNIGSLGKVAIDKAVLPTCCKASWKELKRLLKAQKGEETALVMTGLASMRDHISLEYVALNLREYRINDNQGHQHERQLLYKNGENAIFCDLPLDKLQKQLAGKGYPCQISYHAGTFVCNEIYYRACRYRQTHKNISSVLFVHVPGLENLARSISKKTNENGEKLTSRYRLKRKTDQLACLNEAIEVIARFCCRQ